MLSAFCFLALCGRTLGALEGAPAWPGAPTPQHLEERDSHTGDGGSGEILTQAAGPGVSGDASSVCQNQVTTRPTARLLLAVGPQLRGQALLCASPAKSRAQVAAGESPGSRERISPHPRGAALPVGTTPLPPRSTWLSLPGTWRAPGTPPGVIASEETAKPQQFPCKMPQPGRPSGRAGCALSSLSVTGGLFGGLA